MAARSVQFAVATHIMTALGFHYGKEVISKVLAESVNAEPTFVRKSISKLAKAGLVVTTRGKNGACRLGRSPDRITLRDVYLASEAPNAFEVHPYPIEKTCAVSSHMKVCMAAVQVETRRSIEKALARTTLAQLVADVRKSAETKLIK